MAAESRLLEKPRDELMTLDLVDVLLAQRPASVHAEPGASGTGNRLSCDGAVGVVVEHRLYVDGVVVVLVVGHVYRCSVVVRI